MVRFLFQVLDHRLLGSESGGVGSGSDRKKGWDEKRRQLAAKNMASSSLKIHPCEKFSMRSETKKQNHSRTSCSIFQAKDDWVQVEARASRAKNAKLDWTEFSMMRTKPFKTFLLSFDHQNAFSIRTSIRECLWSLHTAQKLKCDAPLLLFSDPSERLLVPLKRLPADFQFSSTVFAGCPTKFERRLTP
jgi:hypothetical protein